METFIVEEPKRLDRLLSEQFPERSRSYFQYLIDQGAVTCNGKKLKKREIPKVGDEIALDFINLRGIELKPQDIPLDILFEDDHIICINKPAGMVVHPAPGHPDKTFVNALLHHCRELPPQDVRPGIVHRLDKDTSGVLIAAKTLEAHQKLIEAFSNRTIQKEYLAVTVGNPGTQTIDAPIGRHPVRRKEMTILENGRKALTHIETLTVNGDFSLVRAKPVTGRTHQIRVHLRHIKTPVIGDQVYGPIKLSQKMGIERQLLHAHKIAFTHPITAEQVQITAPTPEDFNPWIEKL